MSETVETGRLVPYLIEMFRYQAWVAMGKVMNPVTQKIERDLAAARQFIDFLGELESRTEGHRSEDESRMLRGALTELRLNYLEEMKKPADAGANETEGTGASAESGEDRS